MEIKTDTHSNQSSIQFSIGQYGQSIKETQISQSHCLKKLLT